MYNKNILFLLHQDWTDIFKPFIKKLQKNENVIAIHFYEKIINKRNLEFLNSNKIDLVSFNDISTSITSILKKLDSKNTISQFISEKILLIEYFYYYKVAKKYLKRDNISLIYLHTDINWRIEVSIIKAAKDLSIPVVIPASILMEPDISNIRNNSNFFMNKLNSYYQSKTFNKFKSKKYGVQNFNNYFRYKAYILNFLYKINSLSTAPFVFGGSPNTTYLCVCNEYAKQVAIKYGVLPSKVIVTGDLNYDILYENYQNKNKIKADLIKKEDRDKKIVIFAVPQLFEHNYTSREKAFEDIEYIISNILEQENIKLLLSLHPMMDIKNYIYLEKKFYCNILDKPLVKVLPIADLYIAPVSNTLAWSVLCEINTLAFDFYDWDLQFANALKSITFIQNKNQLKKSIENLLYNKVDFSVDFDLISKELVFDGNSLDRHFKLKNLNGEKEK